MVKYLLLLAFTFPLFFPWSPADAAVLSATYYANSFVGKKMKNGQRFRQHLLIAAHPTYKMGTRLRLTNKRTGRSIVVRVADRCRCSLDLSKAAFKQVGGKLNKGRVLVKVTKLS